MQWGNNNFGFYGDFRKAYFYTLNDEITDPAGVGGDVAGIDKSGLINPWLGLSLPVHKIAIIGGKGVPGFCLEPLLVWISGNTPHKGPVTKPVLSNSSSIEGREFYYGIKLI